MFCKSEVPCSVPKKQTLYCIRSEMIQWIPKQLQYLSVVFQKSSFFSVLPTELVTRTFKMSGVLLLFLTLIFINKMFSIVNYRYF